MRAPLATALAALVCASPAGAAPSVRPGEPAPGACGHEMFSDVVGTLDVDVLEGDNRPRRMFGLTGSDWLTGSKTRATCLFGGQDDDVLVLSDGGGIAHGEDGADVLQGSSKSDGLTGGDGQDVIYGGAGDDVLRGGRAVDGLYGGEGDDLLDARDDRPEVVDCGPGDDTVLADASDVVVSCEKGKRMGDRLPVRRVDRRRAGVWSTFHVRFRAPVSAGASEYRVLLAASCDDSLRQVASVPRRVRAGRKIRVGLPAPTGGWCPGPVGGAIVRMPPCPAGRSCILPRPVEPVAMVAFRVSRR